VVRTDQTTAAHPWVTRLYAAWWEQRPVMLRGGRLVGRQTWCCLRAGLNGLACPLVPDHCEHQRATARAPESSPAVTINKPCSVETAELQRQPGQQRSARSQAATEAARDKHSCWWRPW
jgi:hypothetical protein